jgi:hypothetical protein
MNHAQCVLDADTLRHCWWRIKLKVTLRETCTGQVRGYGEVTPAERSA